MSSEYEVYKCGSALKQMKLLHFWSPEKLGRVWTEPYLPRCRLSVRSSGFLSVAHECLSETCWLAQGDGHGIRFYAMLLWHHRSQFKKMTCPDLCFIFARRRPQSSSTIFSSSSSHFSAIGITFFTLSTPKTLIILEDKLCVLCFEVTSSAIIDF